MKNIQSDSSEAQDLKSEIQNLEHGIACLKIIKNSITINTVDELEDLKELLEEQTDELYADIESLDEELTQPLWHYLYSDVVHRLKMSEPFGIESDEYSSLWQELQNTPSNSLLSSLWEDTLESEVGNSFHKLSRRDKLILKLDTQEGLDSLEWWKSTPAESELDIAKIEEYIDGSGVIRVLKSMVISTCKNEYEESKI